LPLKALDPNPLKHSEIPLPELPTKPLTHVSNVEVRCILSGFAQITNAHSVIISLQVILKEIVPYVQLDVPTSIITIWDTMILMETTMAT
jgi:hypothetical protein